MSRCSSQQNERNFSDNLTQKCDDEYAPRESLGPREDAERDGAKREHEDRKRVAEQQGGEAAIKVDGKRESSHYVI